jgi:hypothetical protein
MTFLIFQNEASAASRTIPLKLFQSDGTSADPNRSGSSLIASTPSGATFIPASKMSALNAAQGMYFFSLLQSDVSLVGPMSLYCSQGSFPQHVANVQVVAFNPYDGARLALSNITIGPGTYSGVTFGVNNIAAGTYSGVTVGINNIAAGAYSGVTIGGSSFVTINPGTYSSVTVSTGNIAPGTYSGVTVGINNILAGTYSGVTVGINNIAAGNYSGVTISGVTATNVLDKTAYGVTSIAAGTYSGVTVGSAATILAGGIATASFAAAAIDNTVLSTNAEQAIADRLLLRSVAGGADSGHTIGHALMALRNKVDATSSVGTVYLADGTTSAWTFSNTTAAFPLGSVTPG